MGRALVGCPAQMLTLLSGIGGEGVVLVQGNAANVNADLDMYEDDDFQPVLSKAQIQKQRQQQQEAEAKTKRDEVR